MGLDLDTLLRRLFHEQPLRVSDPAPLRFFCSCSRERSAGALLSLGRDDVELLLVERGSVDIDCQFCNRHYHFDAAEAVSVAELAIDIRSEEHTFELQSRGHLVCRLLLEKKKLQESRHSSLLCN